LRAPRLLDWLITGKRTNKSVAVWLNFGRKSVVGMSLDFQVLNMVSAARRARWRVSMHHFLVFPPSLFYSLKPPYSSTLPK
jgi:hypothetical protein